mmetsp:Transcript_11659/g.33576  ORF Transcript_11659/g.33576 Transcript_11659/m.33576 type:complete len:223 (+) Transcript_11659:286-954(+)
MLDVLTGNSMVSALYPKNAPPKTSGMEIPNHMMMRMSMIPNGTASVDPSIHASISNEKNTRKARVGNASAVVKVARCHALPFKFLYRRAVTYPFTQPMRTKNRSSAMSKAPRRDGFRKPMAEKMIVQKLMAKSCAPVPHATLRTMGDAGGRKTSACTSFQPRSSISSAFSSSVATRLYLAKSCRRLRSSTEMIMALSTQTMTRELRMDNQCTLAGTALSMER